MGKKNQKNYSDDLKIRIVNARKVDKLSFGAIAKRFEVSKTAAYDIGECRMQPPTFCDKYGREMRNL